jgi:chemotaxis protein MotA
MDITTVIGIVSGLVLMIGAIESGGGLGWFINVPSAMIVFGGTMATTFISYPLGDVLSVAKVVKNAFIYKIPPSSKLITDFVEYSKLARREGILALERVVAKSNVPFLDKGVRLAVDGVEPEAVRELLDTELAFTSERHKKGAQIFTTMGTFAPAMGMLGTLIGLIQMLMVMDDPKAIGPAMAIALITTFYGSVLANLIFLPLAGKLKLRSQEESEHKQLIMEGIVSIQLGDNPRILEQKLNAFVAPGKRKALQ